MPRFIRTLLLLSILSLLMVPTGKAEAHHTGEIGGEFVAGSFITCVNPHTQIGDIRVPVTVTEHERCAGGTVTLTGVFLSATNDAGDVTVCQATGPAGTIDFSTRETTAGGRGRVGVNHLVLQELGQECRVRITGAFHRVGTDALGRLVLDVHRADNTFREWYCARFVATAVPFIGTDVTAIYVTIEGRQPCREAEMRDADLTHGRDPADNFVLDHTAPHH